jgi:hypothetical protein
MRRSLWSAVRVVGPGRAAVLLLLATLLLLAVGNIIRAAGTLDIRPQAIASGGEAGLQGGEYLLGATIGQAVVGEVSNNPYQLCSGFWCGTAVYKVYLPLSMREL